MRELYFLGRYIACKACIATKSSGQLRFITMFDTFKSRDARERILYANFLQVNRDVKDMIEEIFAKKRAK